jgi:hypothetical protein
MYSDPFKTKSSIQIRIEPELAIIQEQQGLIAIGTSVYSGAVCINIMMVEDSEHVNIPVECGEIRTRMPGTASGAKRDTVWKKTPYICRFPDIRYLSIGVISMDDNYPRFASSMILHIEDECVSVREVKGNVMTDFGETSEGDSTIHFLIVEHHEELYLSGARKLTDPS